MLLLKKQHTLIEFTLIDIPPGIWFSLKIKTTLKRMLSMICTDYYHQNSKDKCMNMFDTKWNGTVKSLLMLPSAEPNIDLI